MRGRGKDEGGGHGKTSDRHEGVQRHMMGMDDAWMMHRVHGYSPKLC